MPRGTHGRSDRPTSSAARASSVSSLSLNRISFYLRCLETLDSEGIARVSSQELARRFHLSAPQIRKDLAQLGELGIRGVGYEIPPLIDHLSARLGLDRLHRMVIVGMGHLGSALAGFFGFNSGPFQVVAGVDRDPAKSGLHVGSLVVRPVAELAEVVRSTRSEIGVLTVPAGEAQRAHDALVAAGIRGVINFSTARILQADGVPVKNVDLRIHLEELTFCLENPCAIRA